MRGAGVSFRVGRTCQGDVMGDDKTWLDETFLDEDWYGRDLSGEAYRGCTFRDVDLTESMSSGTIFDSGLTAHSTWSARRSRRM